MSKELPPLVEGKCAALIDTDKPWLGGKSFSPQRVMVYGTDRCSFNAKEQVGHLHLCSRHAKLAREGFLAENGRVADRNTMRDMRNYPEKFPGGMYHWAQEKKP